MKPTFKEQAQTQMATLKMLKRVLPPDHPLLRRTAEAYCALFDQYQMEKFGCVKFHLSPNRLLG